MPLSMGKFATLPEGISSAKCFKMTPSRTPIGSPTPTALNERQVKALVLEAYRRQRGDWAGDVIASEYRLGDTSVRVDLAILGSNFVGIEIKSELDSLKRLSSQVRAYAQFFDRVIVVVSERHLAKLDWRALKAADVWSVGADGNITVVADQIDCQQNRCLSELLTFAQKRRYRSVDVSLAGDDGRYAFEAEFKERFGRTSAIFQKQVEGREIRPNDLDALSRFRERKQVLDEWKATREAEWEAWLTAVADITSMRQSSDHSSSVS